jgi:uncharacterized membrane protein YgaE (UPF0421/DUF939 family)
MEKDSNKKDNDIDEAYLMSMMAGGVSSEGFKNNATSNPDSSGPESTINKKKKTEAKRKEFLDYETMFFKNTDSNARNGKSVYIRPEFHERLTRIVQVIGEDKISLYAYLDNVLDDHFKEFGEQIKKSFDDKYKPIF